MSITINKNPITKTSNRIGEIIQSNLPILDSDFHLADGSYLTGKIFERVREIEQEYLEYLLAQLKNMKILFKNLVSVVSMFLI